MFNCFATVNLDTEFRVPPDCLRDGDVSCKVVAAECDVVDLWDHWVTFKVRLLLKITVRSGELVCSFTREIFVKETVWLETDTWIKDCDVVAAVCRCVLHRGKLLCNLTVKVEFFLKKKWPDHCGCECGCKGCHGHKKHHRCDDDWEDDWVWTRKKHGDCKPKVCKPKLIHCQPDPCRRFSRSC